jgi:hypothetical protein
MRVARYYVTDACDATFDKDFVWFDIFCRFEKYFFGTFITKNA